MSIRQRMLHLLGEADEPSGEPIHIRELARAVVARKQAKAWGDEDEASKLKNSMRGIHSAYALMRKRDPGAGDPKHITKHPAFMSHYKELSARALKPSDLGFHKFWHSGK